jgi:hypothetical protein
MRKIVSGISEVAAMTEQYDRKEKNSCETGKYFVNYPCEKIRRNTN